MDISVLAAARHLARTSEWSVSNLQLQKLIYLAHMFYLGRTGDPLVRGRFEAWDYGPVHPELYQRAKVFGADPVGDVFGEQRDIAGTPGADILTEVYNSLGDLRPGLLINATHREKGAWARNYIPGAAHSLISNEDILAEYKEFHVQTAA